MTMMTMVTFVMAWLLAATGSEIAAQSDPQALQRMVATERAFAAATAEVGVRDGFLTFFAADAVQIEAGATGTRARVVRAIDALAARPLPQLPLAAELLWNPHTGQMSVDGSLGWLTGPYALISSTARDLMGQGAYFSVWKRQPDGTWRVWLDEGIELPNVWLGADEFRAAPPPSGGAGGSADETPSAAEAGVAAGGRPWQERWSDAVRIHRQGRMPVVGRDAAVAWAEGTWSEVTFHLVHIERAASDDLAVALGGYDARTPAGAEHGTWARVWARDVTGRWRIVFETNKAAG